MESGKKLVANSLQSLEKKKVINEPLCHRCQKEKEDIFHTLLRCRYARKVWKLTYFYQDIKLLAKQDMLSALQELATSKRGKDVELIIVVCCSIWFSWNLLIFEGKNEDSQRVKSIVVVESYQRVKSPANQTILKHQTNIQQVWLPPPHPKWVVQSEC